MFTCVRGVLDPPVSVFSLSLHRHPFLYTHFSSRFTLIINKKKKLTCRSGVSVWGAVQRALQACSKCGGNDFCVSVCHFSWLPFLTILDDSSHVFTKDADSDSGRPLHYSTFEVSPPSPAPSPSPPSSLTYAHRSFGVFRVWPGLVPPAWPWHTILAVLFFLPTQPSVYETCRILIFSF
jgi:hypothetical protein